MTMQLGDWGRKKDQHEHFDESLYHQTMSEKGEREKRLAEA